MRVKLEHRHVHAAAEVVSVAAVYILISTAAVSAVDVSFLFPANWSSVERTTGGRLASGFAPRRSIFQRFRSVLIEYSFCGATPP